MKTAPFSILKTSLLFAASELYGFATRIRNRLYDSKFLRIYQSKLPVVSVGNITAGGNGKTPLSIFLAKELESKGFRPVILTRGYGGTVRSPYIVQKNDDPNVVGDEPLLMCRRGISVCVSPSRTAGAKFIEQTDQGNVIILDDGFQHRALARNIDIVTINMDAETAVTDFLKGHLIPHGRFREDRDRGLSRADIIVLNDRKPESIHRKPIDDRLLNILPQKITVFRSNLEIESITSLDGRNFGGRSAVAFSGIANPDGFLATLKEAGVSLAAFYPFADHHSFSVEEIEKIAVSHPELPLICTEKDAVKISNFNADWRSRIYFIRVNAKVSPTDAFIVQVTRHLG